MRARNGNVSRNLAWIRNQQPAYRALGLFSGPNYNSFHRVIAANGIVRVEMGIRIMVVWVGEEMARYPGAVRMCFNFERDLLPVYDDCMGPFMRRLGEQLAANQTVARSPNAQTVADAMNPLYRDIGDLLRAKQRDYLRSEIRGLRNALARLDVPAEILNS
jgi:hypothetical protein